METPNKKYIPVFVGAIIFALLLAFGLIWLWKRKEGWQVIIVYYGYFILFLVILGVIIGAIIWLFKTQRIDMIHIHKQRIVNACKMNKPSFKQTLMFRGSDELEGRVIGEVQGIAMTKSNPVKLTKKDKDKLKEKGFKDKDLNELVKPKDLYWISFKRSFLSAVEIFCGTKDDFTHLSGGIIYLNGMAFSPPLYDIFFLAKKWQDTTLIDETTTFTIRRYVLQEFLKEEKTIFDDVLAISPQHQKALEQSRMRTIQKDLTGGGDKPKE